MILEIFEILDPRSQYDISLNIKEKEENRRLQISRQTVGFRDPRILESTEILDFGNSKSYELLWNVADFKTRKIVENNLRTEDLKSDRMPKLYFIRRYLRLFDSSPKIGEH